MATRGWSALAQYVVHARQAGRWRSRREFAAWLGVSGRTLDNLEHARRTSYSPETMAAVESGMEWEPGSFEKVAAGGKPTRVPDADLERLQLVWVRLSPDARRMLVMLAEQAVTAAGSPRPGA